MHLTPFEAERPPAAGVAHAGEIEVAECTLVEGVELVETEGFWQTAAWQEV